MNDLSQPIRYVRTLLEPYIAKIDQYLIADSQETYYEVFKKRKVRGGYRYIYRCTEPTILSAQKVVYEMLRKYQQDVLPCAHGFIKHRSTLTNARVHTGQHFILHIDIKNFFDAISVSRVNKSLLRLGISNEVADLISRLTTVDGVARQGLHTSPDLSNHCLYELDIKLMSYCESNNVRYSRYGDDMTFSGSTPPSSVELESIIEIEGFQVNTRKLKLKKRGSNQYVTGLTVFDEQPRIPRKFKKRLRLQLHYIQELGFEEHVMRVRNIRREDFSSQEDYEHELAGMLYGSANHLIGQVSYVHSVEPLRAVEMWQILNENNVRDYSQTSKYIKF